MMNEISAQQLLIAGGPAMIPLVLLSISAMTLILNKHNELKKLNADIPRFKNDIFTLIQQNNIKAAVIHCQTENSPISKVFKSGLLRFGQSRVDISDSIRSSISLQIPKFEKGLTALMTIANVAPLFGILGTVIGITQILQAISHQTANMTPVTLSDFSGAIWQALVTTIAGLMIAIPAFVAYNYFVSRIKQRINEIEESGEELCHQLTRLNENISENISDVLS